MIGQNSHDILSHSDHTDMKLLKVKRSIHDTKSKHFSILPTSLEHDIEQLIQTHKTLFNIKEKKLVS